MRYSHLYTYLTTRRDVPPVCRSTSIGSCTGQACMPQFRHRFCAFCYSDDARTEFVRCTSCHKRRYCSSECLQADQQAGHSCWCGVTGELGHDFEIRLCDSKGARVYACRTFQKHERIMADRMLMQSPYHASRLNSLPHAQRAVIERLSPHTSCATIEDKVSANQVRLLECPVASATTENGFGMFGVLSRVNHCCLGNSEPLFSEEMGPGWQVLVSTREICAGEEITFCYAPMMDAAARHAYLRNVYGFSCVCRACMQPELRNKLAAIEEHEREIMSLAERRETVDAAVAKGYEQLELLQELQCSSRCLARVYYDLFQVAVSKRGNARVAAQLASLALQHRVAFVGEEDEEAQRYKLFATRPQAHRNYGLL